MSKNYLKLEEAGPVGKKSINRKWIPPIKKTPNDVWLRAFLDFYDFNKDFIDFQIHKMKNNYLPSACELDDDINSMDSGVNKLRWEAHIKKVYEKELSVPSYFSFPTIVKKESIEKKAQTTIKEVTSEKLVQSTPVNVTQNKEIGSVEKQKTEPPEDSEQMDEDQEDNEQGSAGSLWPAIGVAAVIGGIALVVYKKVQDQKLKEIEREINCPNCKEAIIYDSRLTRFRCPYCDVDVEL